jgi:SPP1 family predicted phage head-tail adaptor
MIAGKLDRRITIQYALLAVNSIGEHIKTWTTLTQAWASIEYSDSKETFDAAQIVAPNEVVFKLRYFSDINETMRIIYNQKQYDIKHIAEIGRRNGLKIIAICKDNTSAIVYPVPEYVYTADNSAITVDNDTITADQI